MEKNDVTLNYNEINSLEEEFKKNEINEGISDLKNLLTEVTEEQVNTYKIAFLISYGNKENNKDNKAEISSIHYALGYERGKNAYEGFCQLNQEDNLKTR